MISALMVVTMASVSFVIVLGLSSALLAVFAAIRVGGGCRAGTSLMGASLDWRGGGTCHAIKPLISQTTKL